MCQAGLGWGLMSLLALLYRKKSGPDRNDLPKVTHQEVVKSEFEPWSVGFEAQNLLVKPVKDCSGAHL